MILITALAFTAGILRNELVLTLLGTVFLSILIYCFLGVLLLGIIYRQKARLLSMEVSPEAISAGGEADLCVMTNGGFSPGKNYFLRLPAILIRCELCIETRDSRVIRHYVDPGRENISSFSVKERGAYYAGFRPGKQDRLVVFDAPGFFRLSLPLRHNEGVKLLALPCPAKELIPLSLKSGGSEERNETNYRKSDDLTDHRPYIPGDDPRRINWKLYGHAPLGELFVREGEPEPPPHSRLLILIDTEADRSIYSIDEGRRAVDLLCECALKSALEYSGKGTSILIGYTGGEIMGDEPLNTVELAKALTWPFAIPWPQKGLRSSASAAGSHSELLREELPQAPRDRAVLIFALPRALVSEASALEKFFKKRETKQETDLVFIYDVRNKKANELEDVAGLCVDLYNGRAGVHAVKAGLSPGKGEEVNG
ncbi:MAG: DUF58 domain-containing protein [Treponema sp.]|nr:DUF58 domain-containing protein [Treponema sp.]